VGDPMHAPPGALTGARGTGGGGTARGLRTVAAGGHVNTAVFLRGRQRVVTAATGQNGFTVHGLEDASAVPLQNTPARGTVTCMAVHVPPSGDSESIAAGGAGFIAIHDVDDIVKLHSSGGAHMHPRRQASTGADGSAVTGLAFSEDGDRVFVASQSQPLQARSRRACKR
jgi:hypothetical protein